MDFVEVVQVLLYAALFAVLILKLKFFRSFFVDRRLIAIVFLLRVLAGVIYALAYKFYYGGGDTFEYFDSSRLITQLFFDHDYKSFLKLTFGINTRPPDTDIRQYAFNLSYWNDMSAYFLIRFHAVASIFSFGSYYVHVVFFNWLTTLGLLYLFRFLYEQLMAKKPLVFGVVFFVPSVLFWSSGIHKDGFSLAALGPILFAASRLFIFRKPAAQSTEAGLAQKGWSVSNIILFILGSWLLTIERNYWMMLLVPSLVSWIWTVNNPRFSWLKFLIVHAIYFGVACNLNGILPQWDFLNLIAQKQSEFMSISEGAVTVPVKNVDATFSSLLPAIPLALYNCLFQPDVLQISNLRQFMVALENVAVLFSIIISLIFMQKGFSSRQRSLLWFCFTFSISMFTVIGITVPILGALVRYKIAGELFLLMMAVILVDHLRIFVKMMPPFVPQEKS